MFATTIDMIQVKTFEPDEVLGWKQRDVVESECWFTALAFVKDASQCDLGLKCEILSWEVTIQRDK